MDSAKNQLADRLKSANNILVTVSRDPSVDQLSSLLGLTLLLNKLDKHAAAVFSGEVPSTIEFLQPEDTIEKNTDSLRDFIIALDKAKADKLRYKVEDNVVRIFITPYKTSISQEDFDFSQGDFNVDVVVALGVHQQEDLDEAITEHGRILHDATVASINTSEDGGLGSIAWHDAQASSLSELVTELAQAMGDNLLDNQISTALLTGIVSETQRFSNDKTTSQTMSASAALMAAGANQQLVASKLDEPEPKTEDNHSDEKHDDDKGSNEGETPDGTLAIEHDAETEHPDEPEHEEDTPPEQEKENEPAETANEAEVQDDHELPAPQESEQPPSQEQHQDQPTEPVDNFTAGAKLITEPPTMGGTLTANAKEEALDPVTDPLSLPNAEPDQLFDRTTTPPVSTPFSTASEAAAPISGPPAETPAPVTPAMTPAPSDWVTPAPAIEPAPITQQPPQAAFSAPTTAADNAKPTLSELEASVNSLHLGTEGLDDARDEVSRALVDGSTPEPPKPIAALNAQPMIDNLHSPSLLDPTPAAAPTPPESTPPLDPQLPAAPIENTVVTPQVTDPTAPPPVPPPIPFQFGAPPQNQ